MTHTMNHTMIHTYQTPRDLADINSPFYRPSSPIFCDKSYCYTTQLNEPCMCDSKYKLEEIKQNLNKLLKTKIDISDTQSITEFEYKVTQKRKKNKYIY